jgi:hypothetical protein
VIKVTYISGCPLWERNKRVWSGGGDGGEEQDSYGISITFVRNINTCTWLKLVSTTPMPVGKEEWEGGGGGILWPTCDDTYILIIALVRPYNYKFIYCV